MTRFMLLAGAAMLNLTLVACNDTDTDDRAEPMDRSEAQRANDPNNANPDNPNDPRVDEADRGLGQTPPANAAPDPAAGPAGMTTPGMVGPDTEAYVRNAALGDLYEIRSAEIALERAGADEVLQLAQMILDDHTRMQTDMTRLLLDANLPITPPAELDARRQGLIDSLNAASDDAFDRVFLEQQASAHMEALALHNSYANDGENEALAAFAADAVPVLEQHIDAVTGLLTAPVNDVDGVDGDDGEGGR
jgi:putative membrane protein